MGKILFREGLLDNYVSHNEKKIALFEACIKALKKSKKTVLAKRLTVVKRNHELGLALAQKTAKKINNLGGDELALDELSLDDDFEPDPYLVGVGL